MSFFIAECFIILARNAIIGEQSLILSADPFCQPFIANGKTGFDGAPVTPVCFMLPSGEMLEVRECPVGNC